MTVERAIRPAVITRALVSEAAHELFDVRECYAGRECGDRGGDGCCGERAAFAAECKAGAFAVAAADEREGLAAVGFVPALA